MNLKERGGERPAPAQVVQQSLSGSMNLSWGERGRFCGQLQLASLCGTTRSQLSRKKQTQTAAELHLVAPLLLGGVVGLQPLQLGEPPVFPLRGCRRFAFLGYSSQTLGRSPQTPSPLTTSEKFLWRSLKTPVHLWGSKGFWRANPFSPPRHPPSLCRLI